MKRNPVATGHSTKLQSVYSGPLVIVGVGTSDTYHVKKLNECNDRNFVTTAHVSQLKIFTGKNSETPENSDDDISDAESCDENNEANNTVIHVNQEYDSEADKTLIEEGNEYDTVDKTKNINVNERPKRVSKKPKYLDDFV